MTSSHEDRHSRPLSSRDLLTGELPGVLSLWDHARTPTAAQALLALWAGLQRLEKGPPDSDEDRLNALVHANAVTLAQLASDEPLLDAHDWVRRAEELDRAWEKGEETPDDLDWQAHELFEQLDRAALAAWAVDKFAGPGVKGGVLPKVREALGKADDFVVAQVDLFLCLATDLAAVLSAVRPGLEEQEFGLWETLLRHRRVEEARDELEVPPGRAALLRTVRRAATDRPGQVRPTGLQPVEDRVRVDPRPALLLPPEAYDYVARHLLGFDPEAEDLPRTDAHDGPTPPLAREERSGGRLFLHFETPDGRYGAALYETVSQPPKPAVRVDVDHEAVDNGLLGVDVQDGAGQLLIRGYVGLRPGLGGRVAGELLLNAAHVQHQRARAVRPLRLTLEPIPLAKLRAADQELLEASLRGTADPAGREALAFALKRLPGAPETDIAGGTVV